MIQTRVKISIDFDLTFKVDNSSIVPKMEVMVDEKYNSQTHLMIKKRIKLIHKDNFVVNSHINNDNYLGEIGQYYILLDK